MNKDIGFSAGEEETRRGILKKIGSVGTITIPTIAAFHMSQLRVHASGIEPVDLDTAWNTYWSNHDVYRGFSEEIWSTNKENWYEIWQLIGD